MADESTILLQYLIGGEEKLLGIGARIQAELSAQVQVIRSVGEACGFQEGKIRDLTDKVFTLSNALKIANKSYADEQREIEQINKELASQDAAMLRASASAQKLADAEKARNLRQREAEIARLNAAYVKEEQQLRKVAAAQNQLTSAPLGNFMAGLAGGADKLAALETNAYNATRQSALFSQMLVTQPIKTLGAFAQATNKAAIASQYFKEQLQFIAASRFGSIMIWSAVFGTIAAAIGKVISTNIELDDSIHRVSSAFVDEGNVVAQYSRIQDRLVLSGITFGKTYKETAEVMWELKSAGLSVKETYAGIDSVQKLMLAGAEDINQTTRLTAGLYKTFGDEIKGATTDQQKFAEIAGTIAYVNLKSQATIDSLLQSYKYASGVAKSTGVSFNELSAVIEVSNNRMLYGSTAGTGFAQALINIAKNYKAFARDFNMNIDPAKPLQFTEFLHQLASNQDLVNGKLAAMGTLAEDSNARALRVLLANVQGVKEYDEVLGRLNQGNLQEFLDKIADERLNTFSNQWARLKETVKGATLFEPLTRGLTAGMKALNDTEEATRRVADSYKLLGDNAVVAYLKAKGFLLLESMQGKSTGTSQLEDAKKLEKTNLMKASEEGSVEATLKLREFKDTAAKTFADLLAGEKAEEYQLLQNSLTLEAQIKMTKEKLAAEKDNALFAHNVTKDKKEEEKAIDNVLKLQSRLNTLQDSQRREQEKIVETQARQAKAANDLALAMAPVAENTPADQILKLGNNLEEAFNILKADQNITKDWSKDAEKLANNFLKVRDVSKIVDDAFKRVESEMRNLQSASSSLIGDLVGDNRQSEASRVAEQMLSQINSAINMAPDDESRISLEKERIALLKEEKQYNLGRGDITRQILDAEREMVRSATEALSKRKDEYTNAVSQKEEFDKTAEAIKNGTLALTGWQSSLDKSVAATTTMRQNFERMAEIASKMGGVNFSGSANVVNASPGGARDLEKAMYFDEKSGSWTGR